MLFFVSAENTAAAIDSAAEMNRRNARLSMKIGAKVWVNVLALTPGGAIPRKTENSAAEAGTLASAVPRKWLSNARIRIAKYRVMLTEFATFCIVARIPDAAPRVSAGTELMMREMLGEANIPAPTP